MILRTMLALLNRLRVVILITVVITITSFKSVNAQLSYFDFTDIPSKDSITRAFTLNNAYDALNSWYLYRNTKVKIVLRCRDTTFQQCSPERYYFFNQDGTLQKDSSVQETRITRILVRDTMRIIEITNRGRVIRQDTIVINSNGKVMSHRDKRRTKAAYIYGQDGRLKKETRQNSTVTDEITYEYFKDSLNLHVTSFRDGQSHSQMQRYKFNKHGQQLLDSVNASEYKRYSYENKRLVKVQTASDHWEIKYGPGKRKAINIYDEDKNVSETIIHEYVDQRTELVTTKNIHGDVSSELLNKRGKLVEIRTIGLQGDILWPLADTRGRLLREFKVSKSSGQVSCLLYQYVDY